MKVFTTISYMAILSFIGSEGGKVTHFLDIFLPFYVLICNFYREVQII